MVAKTAAAGGTAAPPAITATGRVLRCTFADVPGMNAALYRAGLYYEDHVHHGVFRTAAETARSPRRVFLGFNFPLTALTTWLRLAHEVEV